MEDLEVGFFEWSKNEIEVGSPSFEILDKKKLV